LTNRLHAPIRISLLIAAVGGTFSAGTGVVAESTHLFGVHSWDWAANLETMSHRTGWVVEANLSNQSPDPNGTARPITGESFTLIQRLDWTWEQTVPLNTAPADQDTFAQQCAIGWARQIKKYCRYYAIGNEMEFFDVEPADYAQAFTKIRNAIKAEQPEAMVLVGHWNNEGNMRATLRLLGRNGYDGIVDHVGSSIPTSKLDMLDQENARPEVGVYITEWGWVRDTNPNSAAVMKQFYAGLGQSNASRNRQVFCACFFLYKSGIGWDHFAMEISTIDKPAFAACTALGTTFNSFASLPVIAADIVAEVPDTGSHIACSWTTNVPSRRQLWWRGDGAASGASSDLNSLPSTVHQISTSAGFSPGMQCEVMPSSTADGRGDFGGRRFRVKTGPWVSQAHQVAGNVAITWNTDWPANSRVEYGSTPILGQIAVGDDHTTAHSVILHAPAVGPLYYRVLSSEPNPDGGARLYMRSPIRSATVRLPIPGDFDRDGDVDQEDFGHLQDCLSGPGIEQIDEGCVDARLDEDTDVDRDDVEIFISCYAGPRLPPAAGCPQL
jgi:hypothetical protein